MGQMRFLTSYKMLELDNLPPHMRRAGDTKINWDPDSKEDCELAKENFNSAIKKGYKIYKVGKDGKPKGSPVDKFSKKEALYIVVPSVAGG